MELIRKFHVTREEGVQQMSDWYFEYEIQVNRPGLLGDIASLLGMLRINIISVNGVDETHRGMLVSSDETAIERFRSIVAEMEHISFTKFRVPKLRDRLAVRHGHYIARDSDEKNTFRFVRDELGILVDFLAELFKREGHCLIGVRGMPRVGKTESVVAASVCANKKWVFLSSTMIKQTVRNQLMGDEFSPNNIFILDGVVTARSTDERHAQLVREIMSLPGTKVVEHPDMLIQAGEYKLSDFNYIIELRHHDGEEITFEMLRKNDMFSSGNAFDSFNF